VLGKMQQVFSSVVLASMLLLGTFDSAVAKRTGSFFSGTTANTRSPMYANPVQSSGRALAVQAYNLGVQQFTQQNYSQAAISFTDALNLDPTLQAVHGPLGQVLFLNGEYQSALPHLQSAVLIEVQNSTYWCQLGVTAARLGARDIATEAFNHYLALEPQGSYAVEAQRSLQILQAFASVELSASETTLPTNYLNEFGKTARRWKDTGSPLKVFLADCSSVPGFDSAQHQVVRNALSEWTRLSSGKIRFEIVDRPEQAQIACNWTADRSRLQASDDLGATTLRFNSNGDIEHATVLFLTTYSDTHNQADAVRRAQAIALHEVGHALGLQHSHQPADIMFATVAPLGLEFFPSVRDRNTLRNLYRI
jgi:tetratricopeptide (TPR) repeat protein